MNQTSKKWSKARVVLFLLLFFSEAISLHAQDSTVTSKTWTLSECLEYALENHPSVKNSQLDIKISQAKVKETVGLGLPSVSGKVDYLRNLEVQSQFVPANAFEPAAPPDLIIPLGFGVDHTMNANLTVNQLIFDGSYLVGLKASKVYKSLSETTIELTKKDIRGNVIMAYVMVLISEQYYNLIQENQKSLDSLLRDTRVMYENGFVEQVDVQRLQATVNNGKVQVITAENNLSTSKEMLAYQMGLDFGGDIVLSESLDQITEGKKDVPEETPVIDPEERVEYQIQQIQNQLNELSINNDKVKALPSIYAFASLGYNTGAIQFGDMMDNWQSYSMIGVTLSWDIFTGFQRQKRIEQSKYELAKSENDLDQLERTIKVQIYDTHQKLKNQAAQLQTSMENYKLNEQVYKATKTKYLEGTVSNLEVAQASTDVIAAQRQYFTALYNAIVAKIEFEYAKGNLEY